MAYVHLYKGSPTVGLTDGSQVSEGTELNPITTSALNLTINEVGTAIKLAIRCDAGYNTSGNTTITPAGTNSLMWALSLDGITWMDYGAVLTISTVIGVVNTIFYARAKSVSTEIPVNDITVDLQIVGNVVEA